MTGWLKDAAFYEIYPQPFCDTNGDGFSTARAEKAVFAGGYIRRCTVRGRTGGRKRFAAQHNPLGDKTSP